jgi:PAS domain-containing protein
VNSVPSWREPDGSADMARLEEELPRANECLRLGEAKHLDDVVDALPAHVAVLNAHGTIVSVNAAWEQFADENGLRSPAHGVGTSYLDACEGCVGVDGSIAAEAAYGIRAVLAGHCRRFELQYPCHSPTQERWFLLRASALGDGTRPGAVLMHEDITLRVQAATNLARLSLETERRERMLNSALSSISDYSYIFDPRAACCSPTRSCSCSGVPDLAASLRSGFQQQ